MRPLAGAEIASRCSVVMRGGNSPLLVLCKSRMADGDGVLPPITIWAYTPHGKRENKEIATAKMGKMEYLMAWDVRDVCIYLNLAYKLYTTIFLTPTH